MNFSHRVCLLAFCMAAFFGTCARAQFPPKDELSALKQKESLDGKDREAIQKFVSERTAVILDEKSLPAAVKTARDALVNGIKPDSNTPVLTVSYKDEYANQVNKAFANPSLAKTSVRTRLNVAVVAGEAGTEAQNARLEPTLLALLNDPEAPEPVVLWAIRGASGAMPALVKINVQLASPLLKAIQGAVGRHPASGLIYVEAYKALQIQEPTTLTPALIGLLQARLAQFQSATLPEAPTAEYAPASFLVTKVWKNDKSVQSTQIAQLVSNLLWVLANRVDDPKLSAAKHTELLPYTAKFFGGLPLVMGNTVNDAQLIAAANKLYKAQAGPLAPLAKSVCDELQRTFGIKAPPAYVPLEDATNDTAP